MFETQRPSPLLGDRFFALSALISASLLAGAHAFERIGGYEPCLLCLRQREAHWLALGLIIGGWAIWKWRSAEGVLSGVIGVIAVVYAGGAVLAFYHAGAEYGFWPGPSACSGSTLALSDNLLNELDNLNPIVSCTDAPWTLFGVSMAGYNGLISAALAAVAVLTAANGLAIAKGRLR